MGKQTGRRYKRQPHQADSYYVMTCLRPDAYAAVCAMQAQYDISASGAVHHLIRVASGLDSLLPS